jgi:hypothetical protein
MTCAQFSLLCICVFIFGLLEIWILQYTWNQSVPYVFGLPTINFTQALCIYMVSSMLICPKFNFSDKIVTMNDNARSGLEEV